MTLTKNRIWSGKAVKYQEKFKRKLLYKSLLVVIKAGEE